LLGWLDGLGGVVAVGYFGFAGRGESGLGVFVFEDVAWSGAEWVFGRSPGVGLEAVILGCWCRLLHSNLLPFVRRDRPILPHIYYFPYHFSALPLAHLLRTAVLHVTPGQPLAVIFERVLLVIRPGGLLGYGLDRYPFLGLLGSVLSLADVGIVEVVHISVVLLEFDGVVYLFFDLQEAVAPLVVWVVIGLSPLELLGLLHLPGVVGADFGSLELGRRPLSWFIGGLDQAVRQLFFVELDDFLLDLVLLPLDLLYPGQVHKRVPVVERPLQVVRKRHRAHLGPHTSRLVPADSVWQLEHSLLDGVPLEHLVGGFEAVLDQGVLLGHHAHLSDHVDLAVEAAVGLSDLLVESALGLVELVGVLDGFELDSQPLLLEAHPVLLVPVDSYDYFLEDVFVLPAKVVVEEGVAVGVVAEELPLLVRQPNNLGRLLQLDSLVAIGEAVLPDDLEAGFANLYYPVLEGQDDGSLGLVLVP